MRLSGWHSHLFTVEDLLRKPRAWLKRGHYSLRRTPTQPLSSQQVEGKVKDDLPAFAVAVQHQAESPLGDPLLPGDVVRHQEEVSEESIITLACIKERREMPAGKNQDLGWGLRGWGLER